MEVNLVIVSGIELLNSNDDIDMNEKEGEISQDRKEPKEKNDGAQPKCQPKQLATKNNTHQLELNNDDDDSEDSCENRSTCTILEQSSVQKRICNEEEEDKNCSVEATSSRKQILSVSDLNLAESREKKVGIIHSSDIERKQKEEENFKSPGTNLVEIELKQSNPSDINEETNELNNGTMFSAYHHERAISSQGLRGFSESKPKLSFSSQQMKEYFESFKTHSGETIRLYQFFKSTRTELVACLLFTLITSQALIMSKTLLNNSETKSPMIWPLISKIEDNNISIEQQQLNRNDKLVEKNVHINNNAGGEGSNNYISRGGEKDYLLESRNSHSSSSNGVVHLASGLITSFTVTSLTQVFGHVSGCHLLPSISLALFIKGHISRARLVSYLAAQSIGSLLGVSLLSLLTGSQITPEEYHQILLSAGNGIVEKEEISRVRRTERRVAAEVSGALNSIAVGTIINRRRKREADVLGPDINLNDIQGSETILMSIVEQQQEHQFRKQQQQGKSQEFDKREIDEERTITANVSTDKKGHLQEQPPHSTPDTSSLPSSLSHQRLFPSFEVKHAIGGSAEDLRRPKEGVALRHRQQSNSNATSNTRSSFDSSSRSNYLTVTGSLDALNETGSSLNDKSRVSEHATGITTTTSSSDPSTAFEVPQASMNDLQLRRVIPGNSIGSERESELESNSKSTSNNKSDDDNRALFLSSEKPVQHENKFMVVNDKIKKLKLRRKKRNKQQVNATTNILHLDELNGNNKTSNYYINMLEFALPDSIMSSDSIRKCIGEQNLSRGRKSGDENLFKMAQLIQQQQQQLAGRSFRNCLSLSNSSQMFIFQLLATLLIVLTYLINVDPRRTDLGFKSLSIGLSYFVASALTIQSGGFFGNPFHLLFLNWFSPSSSWRVEWFIYLFTPFIAGLFGAISHEYIDFTSLRNRNKQLHLRRSFYSLDNLQGTYSSGNNSNSNSDSNSNSNNNNNNACQQARAGLEISTLNNLLTEPGERARRVSSSSSLESAGVASSVITTAEDHHYLNLQQHQQKLAMSENNIVNSKKAVPYSRQLKFEQRQQLQILANGSNLKPNIRNITLKGGETSRNTNSIRRSDFDSNFLISSSPNSANSRHQINTSGLM